ncbi:MAG: ZIP family metal transporter [Pseudomonadales bacterium]
MEMNLVTMSSFQLLLFYSTAIIMVSLLGGVLPSLIHLNHTRMQVMMSFVSGLMLGIALLYLLPLSVEELAGHASVNLASAWMLVGLLVMFVLLRLFHFHQHDYQPPDEAEAEACGHDHVNATAGGAHTLSWVGVAFGLALHTFIDGIALGASVQLGGSESTLLGVAGLGVFAVIILHKPLDALSITSLMAAAGWSKHAQLRMNILFALMCPLGALLFFIGVGQYVEDQALVVGAALAFSAGAFLCISLSDLLPEVQFHSHDRAKLTLALVFGVLLAWGLSQIEPEHAHAGSHQESSSLPQH